MDKAQASYAMAAIDWARANRDLTGVDSIVLINALKIAVRAVEYHDDPDAVLKLAVEQG
jgi:hypothetical protein